MAALDRLTNIELSFHNTKTTPQVCELFQNFDSELFPNSQNDVYDLAITRFRTSITEMDLMIIEDTTDYSIAIETDIVWEPAPSTYLCAGVSGLQLTNINRILSPGDYVEFVNRALHRCHRNLLNGRFLSNVQALTAVNVTLTQSSITRTISPSFIGTSKTYYVKLTLSNFSVTSSVEGSRVLVDIDLETPDGKKARVAAAVVLESGKQYRFHNGGIRSFNQAINREDDTLDTTYDIAPLDSFLKFKDSNPSGDWKLYVRPRGVNTYSIKLTHELEVSSVPGEGLDWELPNQPPSVSFDNAGFLSWSFPERFLYGNMRIKLGNMLKQSLNLNKIAISNYIELPVFVLTPALDQIVTFKQEAPKLYSIVDVEKLDIIVEGFSLDRDILNGGARSNALTSFMIPKDDVIQFTEVEYVTDSSIKPWRRYRLDTASGINKFRIAINAVYKSGLSRPLLIEPHHCFNLMLSFFLVG